MYEYNIGNATHVGQVRKVNEDYFGNFHTPNGHVFVVCDGMGGHVGGAKASRIAVESIKSFLSSNEFADPKLAIHHAIVNANNSIIKFAEQNPEFKGMGATCVIMLISEKGIFIGHVGDSRIYLYSEPNLIRLTKDHSFVQSLVDMGEITESEAERHPRKNEISNALGLPNMKAPTIRDEPLVVTKNDIILLCSDGLTGIVNDKGIVHVLKSSKTVQAKADILIGSANQGGGNDNITVQLVEFIGVPHIVSTKQSHKKLKSTFVYLLVLILLLAIGILVGKPFLKNLMPNKETSPNFQVKDSIQSNSIASTFSKEKADASTNSDGHYYNEGILDFLDPSKKQDSIKTPSLVNPNAKDVSHWKLIQLKAIDIEIVNFKDTSIFLKQLIRKSSFEAIDSVSFWYEELGEENNVSLEYNDNSKSFKLIPNPSKNGKTIYRICMVDRKQLYSLSDTVEISITTTPIIELYEYQIKLNEKESKKVAISNIIKANRILGFNRSELYLRVLNTPDWICIQNDTIFLNPIKKGNTSLKYEVFNGVKLIGSCYLRVDVIDN